MSFDTFVAGDRFGSSLSSYGPSVTPSFLVIGAEGHSTTYFLHDLVSFVFKNMTSL